MSQLTYRGVEYGTDHKENSVKAETLTYRGNHYSSLPCISSRKRVTVPETYRGIKHAKTRYIANISKVVA